MKRLFRTSKPTVDPLPPPPPPSAGAESNAGSEVYTPHSAQYHQHHHAQAEMGMPLANGGRAMVNGANDHGAAGIGGVLRKSATGLKVDAHGQGHGHPSQAYEQSSAPASAAGGGGAGAAYQSPAEPPKAKGWFGSNNPSVTPFPIDLGGPKRRLSRREKKDKVSAIPTMAEMNASARQAPSMDMQERDRDHGRMVPPPLAAVREGQRSRGNSGAQVQPNIVVQPQRPQGMEGGRPRSSSRFYEGDVPSDLRPAPPPKSPQMPIDINQQRHSGDPYARQASPPLPVPSAPAMQGYSSGRSSPTSQNFYLPPGARPPTPPNAVRASTPTRPPFAPSSMGHSHTSVLSQSMGAQGGYLDLEGRDQDWERERERIGRDGRDRGYSSASGSMRGSDVESSLSHAQHGGRSSKQPSSHAHAHTHTLSSGKSPLATNTYGAEQVVDDKHQRLTPPTGGALFPTPQPHPYALPPGAPSPYSPMSEDEPVLNGNTQTFQYATPVNERPYEDHLDTEMRAMQIQDKERAHAQALQQAAGHGKDRERDKDKDKKKFWGMDVGWGGKRDKEREKEREKEEKYNNAGLVSPKPQYAPYDAHGDRRGSDWSDGIHKGIQGMFGGQHRHREKDKEKEKEHAGGAYQQYQGHNFQGQQGQMPQNGPAMLMEDEQRGRLAGRMHFDKDSQDPTLAKDVAHAIALLCQNPDPSLSAVYSICERIRLTENVDGVSKDAARALRKQFKHGNEAQRRAATVVWLLMMRNLDKSTGFQASSKKFLASFEPLLFAHPDRPLVNQNTHRTMVEVLGDLAYNFAHEKGCEALGELWRKTGPPPADEGGRPLSDDDPIFHPEAAYPVHMEAIQGNRPAAYTYPAGTNPYGTYEARSNGHGGPGYANLPSHTDDIRRLIEESTAAKESARVLAEALVFTRPEDLEQKPIIREFYKKCFHAHESLTNQMGWAQAEAARSHERTQHTGALSLDVQPTDEQDKAKSNTIEEEALASLFEAHAALADAIKQHDEMDRMAMEQREIREVSERSKKDTRMGRDDPARLEALSTSVPKTNGGFLAPGNAASSSRSPSPAAGPRVPASPRNDPLHLPPTQGGGYGYNNSRSRTPSPDSLPHPPPRFVPSPNGNGARPASPLGQNQNQNQNRVRTARPLPVPGSKNPFHSQHASNASLGSSAGGNHGAQGQGQGQGVQPQSNNPFHSDPAKVAAGLSARPGADSDDEEIDAAPKKPSRKALGKRRAEPVDPDNDFDPHDLLMGDTRAKKQDSASSEESVTADEVFFSKPVHYVYDAYQEKLDAEAREAAAAASGRNGGVAKRGGGSGSALMA